MPLFVLSESGLQSIRLRQAQVRVVYPPAPSLAQEEAEWAATSAFPPSPTLPTWDDVQREYHSGDRARLPWHCPFWDTADFVPGLPSQKLPFWEQFILRDHPHRDQFLSFLRDWVGLHDLLLPAFRGPSVDQPFNPDRFKGAAFRNRTPSAFTDFVGSEIRSMALLGCIAKWSDVRGPGGPDRPRLVMALSVEESKPRLIYDARPLNSCIRDFPFWMHTVARVAGIASEDCFVTSHHILLRPSSCPLFGFSYRGVDYVWRVLPFGCKPSPWVYHTLADAKGGFLRSKRVPALAYLDDSLLCNYRATHGKAPRVQRLAAAEATFLAMLVSFFCGAFLSIKKCDFKPTHLQKYLGIWCDSTTATFRVPQDKLDKLHERLQGALETDQVSFETLRSFAGQAMSMSVAIRPASLYTQAMFPAVAALEKSGRHRPCGPCQRRPVGGVTLVVPDLDYFPRRPLAARAPFCGDPHVRGVRRVLVGVWWGGARSGRPVRGRGRVSPALVDHTHQPEGDVCSVHLLHQFCGGHPEVLRERKSSWTWTARQLRVPLIVGDRGTGCCTSCSSSS